MNTEIDDTSDIATLFQRLLDTDYVDNELVKAELSRIGISKAIGFVGPILTRDKSIKARSTAVSILGSTSDPAAIPLLIQALTQDDDGDVRANAAWELGKIGRAEGITPLLIEALSTDKDSKVRQSAAIALGDLAAAEAIPALSQALFHDDGFRVRENSARALSKIGRPEVIPLLSKALDDISSSSVHSEVISSLRDFNHPDTIPVLGKALLNDKDKYARLYAAQALKEKRHRDASLYLRTALDDDEDYDVRAECVRALALIDMGEAIPVIAKALEDDSYEVRLAAATALGEIADPSAIPVLSRSLKEDQTNDIRIEIVRAMGLINHADTLMPLVNALLIDQMPSVRQEISLVLCMSNLISWQKKADLIIQILRESELQRADVDAVNVVSAMMPPNEFLLSEKYALTDYLIGIAKDKDNRITAILAKLIIESASESVLLAGERVNEYEKIHTVSKDEFKKLRIEIGGETALDPIMGILQDDLERHFRKPIADLNDLTQNNWQKTILYAQYGFIARISMSVVVFLVGMVLLSISSWRIMFGQLDQTQLFGAGISFVSGLGSMLLIIYRGPLREIRDSVNDLGIASAAFIAYVHRVLQISHTFSYYYLTQQITFDTMEKSSALIREAMNDTTIRLQVRRADEERHKSG